MTCREVSIDIIPQSTCNMQPRTGRIYIPLNRKVESLTRPLQSGNSIYRVHSHLREVNKRAYEPEIIAIGPYHHGNEKLAMMEEHKVRYLRNLLQHKGESIDRYIEAIKQHQEKVRNFYAEPLSSLSSDELVEMMVLDGCFIIELLRKSRLPRLRDPNDPIFKMDWMRNSLLRDLMLFENQLPFMVLHELFGLVEEPNDQRFLLLLLSFFRWTLPDPYYRWSDGAEYSLDSVKHLLDLIHINWLPPVSGDSSDQPGRYIRCATELREAGVKFEKIKGLHLFDISFENGTLKIPPIRIQDSTEDFLRNLVAHEQYCEGTSRKMFVTQYVEFMDCLINSSKDVELLCRQGIILNWLGDDEAVSDIFNKMMNSVTVPLPPFRYADVVKGLDSHCNKRRHRWMAILRHNIFSTPWAIISFVAAAILLILTAMQTTFTVFPRN